jgi:hypothetical protein
MEASEVAAADRSVLAHAGHAATAAGGAASAVGIAPRLRMLFEGESYAMLSPRGRLGLRRAFLRQPA